MLYTLKPLKKCGVENLLTFSNLTVFGCAAFAHQSEGKLEPRALKCVLLGYGEGVKGYRLWVRENKGYKIIISRNVIFNEDDLPCLKSENKIEPLSQNECLEKGVEIEVEQSDDENHQNATQSVEENEEIPGDSTHNDESEVEQASGQSLDNYQLARDRQRRQIRPPARFNEHVSLLSYQSMIENEPESFEEAINSKDSKEWLAAMQDEM